MSIVERAIKKMQGAAPVAVRRAPAETPIAQTVINPILDSLAGPDGVGISRFRGISGRAINFNLDTLAAAGLLAPGNERLADEYRAIKQPILRKANFKAGDKAGDKAAEVDETDRLVMVASALPGEGKTFTSVNLSLSLAQDRDWSVLLVDTDCRNPSLSRLLGVADEPGLLDYLRSPSENLEAFVLPTNIEKLYVLPLGKADRNAAELLASERMQAVCASLAAGEFGALIAVFDSSPLLLTPEPVILGGSVGQIVVVVRANQTSKPAVAEALGKLDPTKAIGLVLNRVSSEGRVMSYAYGHSYGDYGRYPASE